jgi:serine/threonine protein kinase/WD40 repeat protein
MDDSLIGRQIRGYEITQLLGRGGYGAVYKAYQPAVGRDVAIKVILPEYADNPEFTRRFESEAQLVAQLEHPYIVPLYDFWQDENGAFLVMRMVRGGSLRDQIKDHGPLSLKQVMRLYDHVGSALAIAHGAGVIHRDIKPDNILIDQYTNAYLTDFGIAKNVNLNLNVTVNDEDIIGTPAYLSPEQIKSMPVSPQSDIYSLGIMLYEVLTGKIPFNKPGMQIMMQHLQEPVPSLLYANPELPEALDDIIVRASAKEYHDRYQTVDELIEALRNVIAPAVTPIIPLEAQPRFVKPNQHVFISYSRQDNEFIQRLIYDLESEGIPVWVDKKGLKPGTRNWEDALRNAIRNAYAVLYVASPASRRSAYVLDELAIAEMYNCPVYPVWAAGDEWMDSIPMGMGKMQFIDARGDTYPAALMELVMLLGAGVDDHELLKETDPDLRISDSFIPRNPYKGLRAFRQDDEGDFFGRQALIEELVETLQQQMQPNASRLLAVIGPSGSGKSSVVMAGLLPLLQKDGLPESERWTYLPPMVPGTSPLENLAIALSSRLPAKSIAAIREDLEDDSARGLHMLARQIVERQSSRLVLYVDQFEELFTQTADEAERQQFINLLLIAVTEPGGPVTVILTLRADFYDRPMNYPELGKLIEQNSRSVLPMSLSDLHEVIQKPAQLPDVLLQFDSGLVAELVFEVRDQIGGLPLLQFTLDQLFERRSGRRLTMTAYEEIGGVRGALARHTEATYNALPEDEHRRLARGLFLRLIEPGATEQDTTRRRAPRSELVLPDPAQNRMMDEVINAFVNARLLLMDQQQGITTVEVSHEALIREWPRLAEWLDEARSDIAIQRAVSSDCEDWQARGSRPEDDGLYRGTLLEEAQKWAERNLPSQDEAAFIKASADAQAARKAREEAIARRVQNFGRAAAVLGVMSVIAIIALIASVAQVTTAQSSLATATVAQGLALVQVAVVGDTLTPAGEKVSQANTQAAIAETQIWDAQAQVSVAQSQAEAANTQVSVANATQTPAALTLVAAEVQITAASTQAQGAQTLAANAEQQIFIVGQTLTPVPLTLIYVATQLEEGNTQLQEAQTQVIQANVLADDASTQVVEAREQAAIAGATLTPVPLTLTGVAESLADSSQALSTATAQLALANEQVVAAGTAAAGAETQVAQSNATQTPVALTLAAGQEQLQIAQFTATAASNLIVTAQLQAAGAQTQVADANAALTPIPLTLTPLGITLAAAEAQITAVEPTVNAAETAVLQARQDVANAGLTLTPIPLTLTPIGATLAFAQEQLAGVQPTVDAANTQVAGAGQTLTPLAVTLVAANNLAVESQKQALSQSLAVSADQAINNDDFDLGLVLALESIRANPELVQSQSLLNSLVYSSARFSFDSSPISVLSPDGTTLVVAEGSEAVLWDTATRTERLRLRGHTAAINAVDYSPDNQSILTASADSTIMVWNAVTGEPRYTLSGHTAAVNDAEFSRDGTSIISGGEDNVNIWWNATDGTERRRFTNGTGRRIIRVKFYTNTTRFWSWEQAGSQTILLFWATDRATPLWTSSQKLFTDFESENLQYAFRENDSSAQVTVWDSGSSNETPVRTLDLTASTTRFGEPTAKAFSTNGSIALVAFANQNQGNTLVAAWDYSTNAVEPRFTLQGTQRAEAIAFNGSGTIAAIGFGKQIILYDMANFRELRRLSSHTDIVTALQFSGDSRYLLSRSRDNNTRLWDVSGGDPAEIARVVARTQNNIVSYPGLSADASVVYSIQRNSVFGWNVSDNSPFTRDDAGDIISAFYSLDKPYALVVFPNVSFVYDMSVPGNPARVQQMGSANESNSGAAAWVSGGEKVVIDGNDLALRPVTGRDAREVIFDKSLIDRESELISLAVSPDGRYLVGVSAREYPPGQPPDPDETAQNIIVWDMVSGSVLRTFGADQHNRRINQITISPDSTRVLSASADGTLVVWDIESGRLLTRLSGHRGPVNAGVFTLDGQFVISASDDSTLVQWELETGQRLRTFNGHTAPVKYLALSANGKNFVSSTGDDTVIVWELTDISATIAWTLQNRYIRQLSCEEGRQFGLSGNCDEAGNLLVAGATRTTEESTAADDPFAVTATPTLEPCLVSAASNNTVFVYTGPSRNNSIRFYLPAGRTYQVTGKQTDGSGSTWWRLNWPNPAPREENRYWVAEAEVDEQGGCDSIADADTVAAPTAVPTRQTHNNVGGGSVQPTAVPTQPPAEACSTPLSPVGSFGTGLVEFRWTGMSSAAYYYIIVYDPNGGVVVFNDRTSGSQTSANLDTSSWTATSIDWTIAPIAGDGSQLCNPPYVQASR